MVCKITLHTVQFSFCYYISMPVLLVVLLASYKYIPFGKIAHKVIMFRWKSTLLQRHLELRRKGVATFRKIGRFRENVTECCSNFFQLSREKIHFAIRIERWEKVAHQVVVKLSEISWR
jgi:hypothetical protein